MSAAVQSDTPAAAPPMETTSTPPVPAAPAQEQANPLEAAYGAIADEKHRETIKQKLLQMQTQIDEAVSAKAAAATEADAQRKMVEDYQADQVRSKKVFNDNLQFLASSLKERHPEAAEWISSCGAVADQHPAAQVATARMIHACNIVLADSPHQLGGGRKRARTATEQPPAAAAASPPAPAAAEGPLHVSTPGDSRLRNILSSFDAI